MKRKGSHESYSKETRVTRESGKQKTLFDVGWLSQLKAREVPEVKKERAVTLPNEAIEPITDPRTAKPWRRFLSAMDDDWRERWGLRANELESLGYGWMQAERIAFEEIIEEKEKSPIAFPDRLSEHEKSKQESELKTVQSNFLGVQE